MDVRLCVHANCSHCPTNQILETRKQDKFFLWIHVVAFKKAGFTDHGDDYIVPPCPSPGLSMTIEEDLGDLITSMVREGVKSSARVEKH